MNNRETRRPTALRRRKSGSRAAHLQRVTTGKSAGMSYMRHWNIYWMIVWPLLFAVMWIAIEKNLWFLGFLMPFLFLIVALIPMLWVRDIHKENMRFLKDLEEKDDHNNTLS